MCNNLNYICYFTVKRNSCVKMVKSDVLVFLLFFSNLCLIGAQFPQKLLLTVYYESGCPDSRQFILHQLQPTVERLHDHLILQLIPFGKSKSIEHGYGGFRCQHGPEECLGNLIQDCALDLMYAQSDKKRVAYVACEMKTGAGVKGNLECVKSANLPVKRVENCVKSGRGLKLQMDSEYLTSFVRPTFVPAITVNGVFNQQIQDSALVDLMGTLCSLLKETRPCARHYNNIALNHVLYRHYT